MAFSLPLMIARTAIALLALCATSLGSQAFAGEKDWRYCNDRKAARAIIGCSAVIEDRETAKKRRTLALFLRGNAYAQRGKLDRAAKDFESALALDATFAGAHNSLGLTHMRRGAMGKAVASLDRAIKFAPKLALAFNNRGVALRKLGHYAKARKDFSKALQLQPSYVAALLNRAIVTLLLKDAKAAKADIDRVHTIVPKLKSAILNAICWELAVEGRAEQALEFCKAALAAGGKSADTLDSRAFAYWQLGREKDARADLEAVRAGNAKSPVAGDRLRQFLIVRLKRALLQAGYEPGPADEKAGEMFRAAIRAYQKAEAIAIDGEASDALLRRLTAKEGAH